jgi:hypothetical protein
VRPSLFTYPVHRHTQRAAGAMLHVGRDAIVVSAGIRGRKGVCLILPLETESQWQRRHQRRHEAMVARMLP